MQLQNLILSAFAMATAVQGQIGGMSSELGSLIGSKAAANSGSGMVKVHPVKVGWNDTLTFSPDQLTVNPGEMVQFQFYPKNHSVVQSTFDDPCTPLAESMPGMTGVKSGFMPVSADAKEVPVFTMMVNDTKPMWIYCGQKGHCQKGMVMAINVASGSNKTLSAFKNLAMKATSDGSSSSTGSAGSASGSTGSSGSSTGSAGSTSGSGTATTGGSSSSSPAAAAAAGSSSAAVEVNAASKPAFGNAGLLSLFVAAFTMFQL
ncbi:hypothetical protein CPC735_010950 [Paecilomyces variotii No. 5]|uniref:Extracellular serine-rich protein n=1 Tax=Byssochlamys spectabilis (strain No. 5 / NBRC 109023) TaxID=1356009 RepID=V5HQS5_BYSSN|nr:hypothetical protein CPC735_010950 [Paecilomyces variotii No. 5]